MGTPEFAVATLGSLLMNGFNVVGVVTVTRQTSRQRQKDKQICSKGICRIQQPSNNAA